MSKIEKITNIAIVIVCCAVTADLVARRFGDGPPAATGPRQPAPRAEYAIGEAFPDLPGLTLASDRPSLILFVKETCKYCTASMPFYQKLAQTVRDGGDNVALVGVCPDSTDQCAGYLQRHDVKVDRVVGIPPTTAMLKVTATPTLLLIDRGKVASLWKGQLQPDRETEVLAALTRPRTTP
jgi:thiol-disulfide isomerase/thioredoxin